MWKRKVLGPWKNKNKWQGSLKVPKMEFFFIKAHI